MIFKNGKRFTACHFVLPWTQIHMNFNINYLTDVVTNYFLNKIGIIPSPVCSYCGEMSQSLEPFLICCRYTKDFWAEVLKWFNIQGVKIHHLSDKDIMFGILRCEDKLFINHTLIILLLNSI